MFEVCVSGGFVAAHQLRLADGSHEPLHRHDWRVSVTLAGPELDASGMLVDFDVLEHTLDELLGDLNDRNLNELTAFAERSPSAENVARHFAERFGGGLPSGVVVRCAEVQEAPGCLARYLPQPADAEQS